ncbi:hypothetical protein ALC53_02933 [Atta colombica]|uniref:Uncharacterized protein n=1 Tax=Atta colombica TaxID=520822 RepID=A0A195BPL3_9HYME|nr:hypothetical protein ALC53_02933 [Atta colombica]
MCLAIAMYIATGAFSIIRNVLSIIGVFLLTLLGRAILLLGNTITRDYTSRRRRTSQQRELCTDSEDDHVIRNETSLKLRHCSKTIKPAQTIRSAQTSESTHETSISI